jgi:hypothetical protein
MQLDELILHIESFHREFGIGTSPGARADKLFDEVNEFATALVSLRICHGERVNHGRTRKSL